MRQFTTVLPQLWTTIFKNHFGSIFYIQTQLNNKPNPDCREEFLPSTFTANQILRIHVGTEDAASMQEILLSKQLRILNHSIFHSNDHVWFICTSNRCLDTKSSLLVKVQLPSICTYFAIDLLTPLELRTKINYVFPSFYPPYYVTNIKNPHWKIISTIRNQRKTNYSKPTALDNIDF